MHHDDFRARAWAIAVPAVLAALAAGAAPAAAQSITLPSCGAATRAPVFNAPSPKLPVHGEGWNTGRLGTLVFLRWAGGRIEPDGSRTDEGGVGNADVETPAWDSLVGMPSAVDFGTRQFPPGAWPFTLTASSTVFQGSQPVEQVARASTTLVQPGAVVDRLPRVRRRGIVGRSRITLWGVDPALNGRKLYGHLLRSESGGELRRFPAGRADADACTPETVPRKVRLLSLRGGVRQYVRFSDTKRFRPDHDLPYLAFRLEVSRTGKSTFDLTVPAVYAGAPIPSSRVPPR